MDELVKKLIAIAADNRRQDAVFLDSLRVPMTLTTLSVGREGTPNSALSLFISKLWAAITEYKSVGTSKKLRPIVAAFTYPAESLASAIRVCMASGPLTILPSREDLVVYDRKEGFNFDDEDIIVGDYTYKNKLYNHQLASLGTKLEKSPIIVDYLIQDASIRQVENYIRKSNYEAVDYEEVKRMVKSKINKFVGNSGMLQGSVDAQLDSALNLGKEDFSSNPLIESIMGSYIKPE
jgi:hypothetical protein